MCAFKCHCKARYPLFEYRMIQLVNIIDVCAFIMPVHQKNFPGTSYELNEILFTIVVWQFSLGDMKSLLLTPDWELMTIQSNFIAESNLINH